MTTPKICVVTAVIGGIDTIKKHKVSCDVHCFTESNLPADVPTGMSPRLQGKYMKSMLHTYLPDYDGYIWADGSMELLNDQFVEQAQKAIAASKLMLVAHPARNTVHEELRVVIRGLQAGNPYFRARYTLEEFYKERTLYKEKGMPKCHKLYHMGIFARPNNTSMNAMSAIWWKLIRDVNSFDQTLMSYLVWSRKLPHIVLPAATVFGSMVHWGGHAKLM